MTEWHTYVIGDLCDVISDTYKGKDSEVVLINTSDVLEGKILNHKRVENKNLKGQFKKTFQHGDILYSVFCILRFTRLTNAMLMLILRIHIIILLQQN